MSPLDLPFNVEIFQPSAEQLKALKPVTSADYYENTKRDLHEDGLFSISTFGRIGDPMRDTQFSYIDIKTEIFHPVIYQRLVRLKKLYQGIMEGNVYATWDATLKDFVPANELVGQTGFAFFCDHWKEIRFPRNRSDVRDARANLVEKYRHMGLTRNILVIPAGLRDLEVDENGRTTEHEINSMYLKLLSISRVIPAVGESNNDPSHNAARRLLQNTFNEIYTLIENMLAGKNGFFQGKWSSRNVVNSTRNVISAMDTSVAVLGAPNAPRFTDTIVGLWQLSKAVLPLTIHQMLKGHLSQVFAYGPKQGRLVNPQTLQAEIVEVTADAFDKWNTVEGLEKVIASYKEVSQRIKPIKVDHHYLALLYAPADRKVFKIFSDISELPEGASKKDVRPINLMELLYLSGYKIWNDQVGTVTRYPIAGVGSCYPTTVYAKTTVVGEMRVELDDNWQPMEGRENVAPEFPTYDPLAFQDSLVIPSTRLEGLSAD